MPNTHGQAADVCLRRYPGKALGASGGERSGVGNEDRKLSGKEEPA